MENIIKNIKIEEGVFEPTDSQGYEMEGFIPYGEFWYPVFLSYFSDKSLESQVMEQIEEIEKKSPKYQVIVFDKEEVFFKSRETDDLNMAMHLRRCLIANDQDYGRTRVFGILKL